MRCRITFSAGSPKMKERPRSPLQRAAHEVEVLLPDRPVEAQRADGRLDVLLVHLRIDQQPDRIADHVHAEEHDHRHDDDDQRRVCIRRRRMIGGHAPRWLAGFADQRRTLSERSTG